MSDRVRQILLERILDGTYPPGYRLVELEIAHELNTSQGPVREALRELEAVRLVETEPYRGTRVREVSARETREAYQVRAVLEEFAAQLAAPRLQGRVGLLQAELDQLFDAGQAGDVERFAQHDLAFHRMIVEAADNTMLLRAWESLGFEVRIRVLLSQRPMDLPALAKSHQPVVDAFAAGDGASAGRLLRFRAESFYPPEAPHPPSAEQ